MSDWPARDDWERWMTSSPSEEEIERLHEKGFELIMDGEEFVGVTIPEGYEMPEWAEPVLEE